MTKEHFNRAFSDGTAPHTLGIIAAVAILAASACSPGQQRGGMLSASSLSTVQRLRAEYGTITQPWLTSYLDSVSARLAPELSLRITILATDTPIAWSPGSGDICLSRGLLWSLQSEGELAFLIAHEIGHHTAKHFSISADERTEALEFEADLLGLQRMQQAGYDGNEAIPALAHTYSLLTGTRHPPFATYPPLAARVYKLRQALASTATPLPGMKDRRDFHRARALLAP